MAVRGKPRFAGLVLLVGLLTAGSGALAGPTLAAPRIHYGLGAWLSLVADASNYLPGLTGALRSVVGPSAISYGGDGRLTVMAVGSDYRPKHSGERLDAVMVATINPSTHQMAAVSIPRDTGVLPLPNNDSWKGKVNSLMSHYKSSTCDRNCALDKMRLALAHVFAIEIDYVVFARFTGFDYMVDQMRGTGETAGYVSTDIPLDIRDTRIWDNTGGLPIGALFLAANDTQLGGEQAEKCHATAKPVNWSNVPPCYHALPYVRSRHGTVGNKNNNNYKRDKRQQSFLVSAVARAVAIVGDPNTDATALNALRTLATDRIANSNDFYTDLPISDDADLLELFNLYAGAFSSGELAQPFLSATMKPDKYAYKVPNTRKYALKIDVVRALAAQWFAPVP